MSSTELVQSNQPDHTPAPFGQARGMGLTSSINQGAVAIESERAIAEAQGQLTLAKRFPRSMAAATNDFLEACKSPDFAVTAFYSVPNRGSGPSIRLAEEAARCYGNFVYGHRELSRGDGKSEIEVYAWDMEKNNRSSRQITVMHVVDTKNGPKKLVDQADIDNKIANVASKQMRGRILALMPKHMIAAGIAEAKRTLAGGNEKPLNERIVGMAQAFGRFGVTNEMLVAHLGHALDNTTLDELADLTGIYNAIKDGAKAAEYFKAPETAGDAAANSANVIKATAEKAAPAATTRKAPATATASNPVQKEGKNVKDSQPSGAVQEPAAGENGAAAGEPEGAPGEPDGEVF